MDKLLRDKNKEKRKKVKQKFIINKQDKIGLLYNDIIKRLEKWMRIYM